MIKPAAFQAGGWAVIWNVPVEFDRKLFHHEEHQDHEGKTKHIDMPSSGPSCPSWLKEYYLSFRHNRKEKYAQHKVIKRPGL
jgi:hypothetical protein